jgi:hypothetical protein
MREQFKALASTWRGNITVERVREGSDEIQDGIIPDDGVKRYQ